MKRRDFLKKSVLAGITAGAALTVGKIENLYANNTKGIDNNAGDFDLVAVKGGEPDLMFEKAIQSLGGMGVFVKKGQKVVVKPNIGWDAPPERGSNTNPKLIKCIIEHCIKAGAKEVIVFDHTCDNWNKTYKNSGIEDAVKSAGGKIIPGNDESFYKEVKIVKGKKLKVDKVHKAILEADVFINVPVLKHHGSAKMTACMKNLMGVNWDRGFWHKNDLHQCIADFATQIKPDLNIIDAYIVMKANGPKGISTDDVVKMKSLIISKDIVAADAAAAKILGEAADAKNDFDPDNIKYIKYAHEMAVGNKNLDSLKINRIKM